MNQRALILTLLFAIIPLFGMEGVEAYPDSMGYIPQENILNSINPIPEGREQAVTKLLLDQNPNIKTLCSLATQIEMGENIETTQPLQINAKNLSKTNYVFKVPGTDLVVKIAGSDNAYNTAVSAEGYDPYNKESLPDNIAQTVYDSDIPRFQHLSTLVTMKLLEKSQSSTITPVKSWAYHIPGQPYKFNDKNYFVVQKKIDREHYIQFSRLDERLKHGILECLSLSEFYRVLKYANLWNPSQENLWLNKHNTHQFAYPDGEKPNNEGAGTKAFRGIAIFGQDLRKAKFNIRNEWDGGHRVFENILRQHCPERIKEWMALYESDPKVK